MVVKCGCVIYKEDRLRFRPLVINIKRVHTTGSISYNKKTESKIVAI